MEYLALISEEVARIIKVGVIIIFAAMFDLLLKRSNSNNELLSAISKLVIGFGTVYMAYPLIEKIPSEFIQLTIFGVAVNSAWLIDYFRNKFKENTKSKIDKKYKQNEHCSNDKSNIKENDNHE